MKLKAMVFVATCLLTVGAFAQDQYALSDEFLDTQALTEMNADIQLDRQDRDRGDIGRANRDDRGHRDNGRYDQDRFRRQFVCSAQNRRGRIFRERGVNQRVTQNRALEQCYRYSRDCRPLRCRVIR